MEVSGSHARWLNDDSDMHVDDVLVCSLNALL